MKKLSDEKILELFQTLTPKYYFENQKYQEKWNEAFLENYWHNFPRFIQLNGNEIKDLPIPKLEANTLTKDLFDYKLEELIFTNCNFTDETYFKNLELRKIEFSNCKFQKKISFSSFKLDSLEISSSIFGEGLSIYDSTLSSLKFNDLKIFESIYITNSIFDKKLYIDNISLVDTVYFGDCYFSTQEKGFFNSIRRIDLQSMNYQWYSIIENIKAEFQKKNSKNDQSNIFSSFILTLNKENIINYIEEEISSGRKSNLNKKTLIEKVHVYYDLKYVNYKEAPEINFKNVVVTEPLTFHGLNLKKFSFSNSEIEKMKFTDCEWNIKDRLLLPTEYISEAEDQYRQLKRMFSKNQDWEMSGLAYISEMEMRKKRLGYEIDDDRRHLFRYILRYFTKKSLEYIVYFIYGSIGGYAQNFSKPLSAFLISTFIGFPLIYLFAETNSTGIYDLPESLQKSISNAFPIIRSELEYQYWSLKAFQTIFSSILLAFIILGLRKRFKQ